VRFLDRSHRVSAPYPIRPPYGQARASLLAKRPPVDPGSGGSVADGGAPAAAPAAAVVAPTVRPRARPFSVVVDLGLETYLVSVFLFADGTISIYSTEGIHSTGLRGSAKVAAAGDVILDDVATSLREFVPVDDIAALPLPGRGEIQILVRTSEGDLAASDGLGTKRALLASLGSLALLLTQLARAAVVEGFDRVEAGELRYELTPDFRRIRTTLLDWVPRPEELLINGRVAGVAVEFGDAESGTITSLFAFADGSASVYRSDGSLTRSAGGAGSSVVVTDRVKELLDGFESALSVFGPAALIAPPQPATVQFVAHVRRPDDADWIQVVAVVARRDLDSGSHPLSTALERALALLRDLT
jgi:hypothetical protein